MTTAQGEAGEIDLVYRSVWWLGVGEKAGRYVSPVCWRSREEAMQSVESAQAVFADVGVMGAARFIGLEVAAASSALSPATGPTSPEP